MRKKGIIMLSITIVVVISALIVTLILLAPKIVERSINKALTKLLGNEYVLQYKKFELKLIPLNLRMEGITIAKTQKSTITDTIHLIASCKLIEAKGIHLFTFLLKKEIHITDLQIQKPQADIPFSIAQLIEKTKERQVTSHKQAKTIYINSLIIEDGAVSFCDSSTHTLQFDLREININAGELQLTTSKKDKHKQQFSSKIFEINAKQLTWLNSRATDKLLIDNLHLSIADSSIVCDTLKFVPQFSMYEYAKQVGRQVARIQLEIPKITIKSIDFDALFTKKTLLAREIILEKPELATFKDKRIPLENDKNYDLLPRSLLLNLREFIYVTIPDIYVKNANLVSILQIQDAILPAKFFMTEINLHIQNLTNDSLQILENPIMRANLTAQILNKGKANIQINIDLASETDNHQISGEMGEIDVSEFNPFLENSLFMRAEKGTIQRLVFDISVNENRGTGELRLYYDDLKIKLLRQKADWFEWRGMASIFANSFIVKSSNPQQGKPLRIAQINKEHNTEKRFINFWIECIGEGIKETIAPAL